ncbi:hypothetical protein [Caulobacter sp. LARHSG274]
MIRPLSSLVLAVSLVAGLGVGGVARAQDRPGLFLDPELLPPDTRPGECVTRRITGPGGAYRWDRVECAEPSGWSDFDRWGYGRRRLDVEEGPPPRSDRYSWRYDPRDDDDWGDDWGYEPYPTYRVAGRDADGFLIWPGKRP